MHPQKYRHIIFDLDRTLWDFDKNSVSALKDLYVNMQLQKRGIGNFDVFHQTYKKINAGLWEEYRNGTVTKETLSLNRFLVTIRECGIQDVALATALSEGYVKHVAEKTQLFPYTHEMLKYLKKKYTLHVLTNGFPEVQVKKLDLSGLSDYFVHIITSEEAGAHKPSPYIFKYALNKIAATSDECLMVGDDPEVDLVGARACGIDQMFVNYDGISVPHQFTFEISQLSEIPQLL